MTMACAVGAYFSTFSSVLIVHDGRMSSSWLQLGYLEAIQAAMVNQSTAQNLFIGVQWLNVANISDDAFQEHMLRTSNIAIEGFITILPNTERFLHARYYATRNAKLRLKDKLYLFLCEHEHPKYFLANEILQFYPHHLMIVPSAATKTGGCNTEHNTLRSCHNNHTNTKWQHINFELWTQKFIGNEQNAAAVYLDAFAPNETFYKNAELYPNKLLDLHGRTLRVGSITYIPYVVTNYVAAGSGNVDSINANDGHLSISFVGSEANLMHTFCQVRNCHLRVAAYGVDNWGTISDNGTADGMLGDLYLQHIELAIGCIYNWYDNLTETSHTIARSAVTILGPAPALFPAWRTNIMPFTNGLWLLVISTMICCVLVMFLIKISLLRHDIGNHYFQNLQQAFLHIFAMFIQQPFRDTALNRFTARVFLAIILCATITLENTYSGQLKSILTLPFYEQPVDTMYKWSLTNWKWAAPSIYWIQTIEYSDLQTEQILRKKFETREYAFLHNASFRNDYGLAIERLLSGAFSFGKYITAPALETKYVAKDDLYFDWTRAVSIRGWPLMPLLNKHVRACMETGLFIYWERKMVRSYLDSQTQEIMLNLASGHKLKSPPQKLKVANISGALFALFIGYVVASAVFCLELCTYALLKKW